MKIFIKGGFFNSSAVPIFRGDESELETIEGEIDDWAAKLWSLSNDELAEIKRSLEEM